MEDNDAKWKRRRHGIWPGLLFLFAGLLLLAARMGLGIPNWVFTWPTMVIAIGLFIGVQHGFRHLFWLIPVFWGSFALLDEQMPSLHLHLYSTPVVLILIGLFFILVKGRGGFRRDWKNKMKDKINNKYNSDASEDGSEFLDSTSVFGGAKKTVISKNFKGGDITCFMGGAEIDFTQADIQGTVRLDITAVFGGAKIIVPSNWDIKVEITAAFGGVEDKRQLQGVAVDFSKTLVLDGTAVFGGIEISNY